MLVRANGDRDASFEGWVGDSWKGRFGLRSISIMSRAKPQAIYVTLCGGNEKEDAVVLIRELTVMLYSKVGSVRVRWCYYSSSDVQISIGSSLASRMGLGASDRTLGLSP
jgi:hypothetical protein